MAPGVAGGLLVKPVGPGQEGEEGGNEGAPKKSVTCWRFDIEPTGLIGVERKWYGVRFLGELLFLQLTYHWPNLKT